MLNLKNILVTTDGSDLAEAAFAFARQLARPCGSVLHLVYVEEFNPMFAYAADVPMAIPPTEWMQGVRDDHQVRLNETAVRLAHETNLQVVPHVKDGTPAAKIVECAQETAADCIIMSTHGRSGFARLIFGSVTERVLRDAPCPVLCVKPAEKPDINGPVLFATDLSAGSLTALPYAIELAKDHGRELNIILVLEDQLYIPPDGVLTAPVEWLVNEQKQQEKTLEELAAALGQQHGLKILPHVRHGNAIDEINACAVETMARCLVMATHGRSGLRRIMLGSVAEGVIRHSMCPILAVKGDAAARSAHEAHTATAGSAM
jgi:nucleotide-binding universal stress UspA family protein